MGNQSRGGRYEPYPKSKPSPIKDPNSPRSQKRKDLFPKSNDPLARFSLPPRPPPKTTITVPSNPRGVAPNDPQHPLPTRPKQDEVRIPHKINHGMRTPKRRALKERFRRSTTPGNSISPSREGRHRPPQRRGAVPPPRLSLPSQPTSTQHSQVRPSRTSLPAPPTTTISTTVDLTGPAATSSATMNYKFELPVPSSVGRLGPTLVPLRITTASPIPIYFLESLPALSIPLQLRLLNFLQSRTEESMYLFCSRRFPIEVHREGWTSRELVELNHIARLLLRKENDLPGGREALKSSENRQNLTTVQRIRHIAVHRQKVSTKILWGFVQCVMGCAKIIGDAILSQEMAVFDRIFLSEVLELREGFDRIAIFRDGTRLGGKYGEESEKLIEGFRRTIEGRIKGVLDSKTTVHQALVLGSRKDLPVLLEDD